MTEAITLNATSLPDGEYAIVEALGHRTLVGRVIEVERFGTKMLQVEPMFGDVMLGPVLLGGSSIYQFTPCSAATAFARRPQHTYQLPPSVQAVIPAIALPSSDEQPSFLDGGVGPICDHEWVKLENGEEACSRCGLEVPF